MNIKKIIKEHHQDMIDKGFYDECDCNEGYGFTCDLCKGTGIVQNKNIGELLMLIVTELSEALEAHRKGEIECDIHGIYKNIVSVNKDFVEIGLRKVETFKSYFGFEIADTKLRVYDLMGYLELSYNPDDVRKMKWKSENVAQKIKQVSQYFLNIDENYVGEYELSKGLGYIDQLAKSFNIPIEKHIIAKMAYNKTRPHKHGKEY